MNPSTLPQSLDTIIEQEYVSSLAQLKEEITKVDCQNQNSNKLRRQSLQKELEDLNCNLSITLSINQSNLELIQRKKMDGIKDIALTLEEQNKNLKEQNRFLVSQVRKMQKKEVNFPALNSKKQKYQSLYLDTAQKLECVNQESQAYKEEIEQIKTLVLKRIEELEELYLSIVDLDEEDGESYKSSKSIINQTKCTEMDLQKIFETSMEKII